MIAAWLITSWLVGVVFAIGVLLSESDMNHRRPKRIANRVGLALAWPVVLVWFLGFLFRDWLDYRLDRPASRS